MNAFAADILAGLNEKPKRLPSRYFYDEAGSELFKKIMTLPEYYLTRLELGILEAERESIRQAIGPEPFEMVDLGAGSGEKSKILLRHFLRFETDFRYLPVDISENALSILVRELQLEFPEIKAQGFAGDYFQNFRELPFQPERRRVVLFLGSNIGNFSDAEARSFLHYIANGLRPKDLLLIGFDLMKDPDVILAAYDDSSGVTREFNLNLLTRINRELDADFDIKTFKHWATYNPLTGACESYLISAREQTVSLGALGQSIHFDAWEAIHMELSQKYDRHTIEDLALSGGFQPIRNYEDPDGHYLLALWGRV
ncbi:MAG: L-histidine N(alpha)-methyltransferase [Saprospirales bacterium]|nr:L-histidine N(alpha)-methyltransferase [Saprospirales bacterium]